MIDPTRRGVLGTPHARGTTASYVAAPSTSLRGALATKQSKPFVRRYGLLRFARNDGVGLSLNRFARIRHRRRQAAIDRDRLSVDIGRVVAGEEQSHRRQFVRLPGALQGVELADLAVGAARLRIVEDRFGHAGFDQARAD